LSTASREEVLDEARAAPQQEPAVTYDTRGKLLRVIDILKRTPPRRRATTGYSFACTMARFISCQVA